MKKIYTISTLFLLLISCNNDGISKDEYALLNESISEILKPYGMTHLSQDEMNEIAANNGIDLNQTMSEKDAKIIEDAIAMRRKFEFAISDSIESSSASSNVYRSLLELDSIVPEKENLKATTLDLTKIRFPENYEKVEKPSENGEFLGKITLSRPIIDKSGEKAIIYYQKCKNITGNDCIPRFIRFRKIHNEWVKRS